MNAFGGALLGVVWGWLLVLVTAPAPRRINAVAASSAGSLVMMLGIAGVHTRPAAVWFAAGSLFGLLIHAACRTVQRRPLGDQ